MAAQVALANEVMDEILAEDAAERQAAYEDGQE